MRGNGRWLAVALAWFLLGGAAEARKKAGVELPDTITVNGKTLTLNGMGVREATALKIDVYVAGLYLEKPSRDPAAILGTRQLMRLDLKFVRHVDRNHITEAWRSGFEKNGGDVAKLKDRIDRLSSWMTDMDKAHSLTFTFVPGKGSEIAVDGTVKGQIEGDDFGKALFSIFLGPQPPNAGLRKGLLGE